MLAFLRHFLSFCSCTVAYTENIRVGEGSFSGIWWSFVFGVGCLWRHIHDCKPTFWRRFFT